MMYNEETCLCPQKWVTIGSGNGLLPSGIVQRHASQSLVLFAIFQNESGLKKAVMY